MVGGTLYDGVDPVALMRWARSVCWRRPRACWAWCQRGGRALALLGLVAAGAANSGTLAKADIERIFSPALVVGEKNADLPVWPLFAKQEAKLELRGYVFESVDFAPVRGYAAKPLNLLVAIDPAGKFLDVRLIRHAEPFFTSAAGTELLAKFAQQYQGLTVHHSIEIFGHRARTSRDETSAKLHGVAVGTVTVMAMHPSIMESAITVARAHLLASESGNTAGLSAAGGAASKGARRIARHQPMSWLEMRDKKLVQSLTLTRSQIEQAFAKTEAAGNYKFAAAAPDEAALNFHTALLSVPQIGRNLLDDAGWRQLSASLRSASQALLVTGSGPLSNIVYDSQRPQSAVPFVLRQGGRELKFRSMAYDKGLIVPGYPDELRAHFLLIDSATPLDPAQPFDLSFRLGRRFGAFPNPMAQADFTLSYQLPNAADWIASSYEPAWLGSWRQRVWEIGVLCLGLALLALALARQRWLSATPQRLQGFRVGYLLFTLGFIGWYAQGQLTILNLTGAAQSLAEGGNLDFFLTDPITVLLWVFVLATLFVWGRGTFCGWLCPFGALQELISLIAQRLGLKHRRLRTVVDTRLKWVKYGALATIFITLFAAPPWADSAIEIEPFKTAISAYFDREWPYVAWALACLSLSVLVYRGYCRYICPLGAALAATDVLRRWAWIPRRKECGTPCQSCRHRCEYQAIASVGKVDYSECFQCLDCVAIYQDDQRCLPLVQARKQGQRVIPLQPVAVT